MARAHSIHILVERHRPRILNAFTVKRELLEYVDRHNLADTTEVLTYADGPWRGREPVTWRPGDAKRTGSPEGAKS